MNQTIIWGDPSSKQILNYLSQQQHQCIFNSNALISKLAYLKHALKSLQCQSKLYYKQFVMDPQFYKNLFTMSHHQLQSAVKGGFIIAAVSSAYFLIFGGILGMSGIAGSLAKYPNRHSTKLKAIIVLGMIFSSALVHFIYHKLFQLKLFIHLPFDRAMFIRQTSVTHLVVAGFLVGLGTELAVGCTSGHGLCGLPRFSARSFSAVLTFLFAGIITATYSLQRFIPQLPWLKYSIFDTLQIPAPAYLIACILGTLLLMIKQKEKTVIAKILLFFIGVFFGCGSMIGGLSQRSKVFGSLKLDSNWDPTIIFVMITGVIVNIITFNLILKYFKTPAYSSKFQNPQGKVTFKLIFGSLLFGVGWGIGGLSPGPYLLAIPHSLKLAVYWGVPFFVAQILGSLLWSEKHEHQHKQNPEERYLSNKPVKQKDQ